MTASRRRRRIFFRRRNRRAARLGIVALVLTVSFFFIVSRLDPVDDTKSSRGLPDCDSTAAVVELVRRLELASGAEAGAVLINQVAASDHPAAATDGSRRCVGDVVVDGEEAAVAFTLAAAPERDRAFRLEISSEVSQTR